MGTLVPTIKPDDWPALNRVIRKLASSKLGSDASPTFAGLTLATGLTLSSLTASRLVASDADKQLVSSDIASWVSGTADRLVVTDDGDGTITLNISETGIDHGGLAGRDDDDHSQYHNDTRAAQWLTDNHETTYNHTNYDTAYSHSQLVTGNPHSVTPIELSLVIGTNVQAFGEILDDLNILGVAASDSQMIVATGAGAFAYESGATLRTSIGVDAAGTAAGLVGDHETTYNHSNYDTAYTHSQIAGGDSVHVSTTENTNWDSAYTHVSNNGTDHSYIDQSVLTTAAPSFAGMTLTADLTLSSASIGKGTSCILIGDVFEDNTDVRYCIAAGFDIAPDATGICYNSLMTGYHLCDALTGTCNSNLMTGYDIASAEPDSVTYNIFTGHDIVKAATGELTQNLMVGYNIFNTSTGFIGISCVVGGNVGNSVANTSYGIMSIGDYFGNNITGAMTWVTQFGRYNLYNTTNETNLNRVIAMPYEALRESSASDLDDSIAIGYRAGYQNAYNSPALFGREATATANKQTVLSSSFYTGGILLDNFVVANGSLKLKEQSSADADAAGYGQLWCKDNAGTTELWFTDDSGTDTQIV